MSGRCAWAVVAASLLTLAGCSSPESPRPSGPAPVVDATAASAGRPAAPARSAVDLPLGPIPEADVAGRVHGESFALNGADLRKNVLTLHGDGGLRFFVFLPQDGDGLPTGRTFEYVNAGAGAAQIHMHYADEGRFAVEKFPAGYTMRLELDPVEGSHVTGRIYLAVPDEAGTFVAGSFEAELLG